MRSKNEKTMQDILDFINESYFSSGSVPTLREIADEVGLDKSNVSRYLSEMEERGMISRTGGARGVETERMRKLVGRVVHLPVVGEIACGSPILAEENIESYVTISASFLDAGDHFILRARGESMINVGIRNGDYVIIRKQQYANEGDIVVAMVDGSDCTLKRYYIDRQQRKIRLHPENDALSDMYFDTIAIQGVAVKVIKNIAV
ncbi:MAG: transcriptional repressor LexA [Clostridia bacterium]|nr:transcriptional repressor LexA [Clostridia bacterium]